jgi:hypothetical protein
VQVPPVRASGAVRMSGRAGALAGQRLHAAEGGQRGRCNLLARRAS